MTTFRELQIDTDVSEQPTASILSHPEGEDNIFIRNFGTHL